MLPVERFETSREQEAADGTLGSSSLVFRDGFELGNTTAWTVKSP